MPGTLLASVPQMLDPNFMHSVVVMVEHHAKGALGLVVNHPTELSLAALTQGHPLLDGFDFPVYGGGPVGHEGLQFLHRLEGVIEDGLPLGEGLFLGGRIDDLARALREGKATSRDLRFLIGYAGWGEGQLDQELASGSWVPAPPNPDLIFHPEGGEPVWRELLRGLGDVGRTLSQLPPDVNWN